jgi:hypothetical protein
MVSIYLELEHVDGPMIYVLAKKEENDCENVFK